MENIQKANIINVLENSKFAQCVYVAIILTVGLIIRVYFLPFDVPLFNDAQGYFWYAIDSSILNSIPVEYPTLNNGWPLFLSIIFQVTDFETTQLDIGKGECPRFNFTELAPNGYTYQAFE